MENNQTHAGVSSTSNAVADTNNKNADPDEIIIPDECGDTLWDKVLAAEVVKPAPGNKV